MQTARKLLIGVVSCAMLGMTLLSETSSAQAAASDESSEKQVNVKVITSENGTSETVDKILTIDKNASIESILRDMGVIDEFGQIAEDEIVEIIVRRTKNKKVVKDLAVELEAEPAPGPPVVRKQPQKVGTGFLGVNIGEVNRPGVQAKGVLIRSIIPNTGAEDSDLRAGDVITKLEGIPVANVNQLVKTVQALKPGTKVEVEYKRNDQTATTQAVLGTRAEYLQEERRRGIERFQERARELEKTFERPFLGVSLKPGSSNETIISRVHPNTAASEMGLQPDDKILSINGQEISGYGTLKSALMSHTKVGEPVVIGVKRGGNIMMVNGTMKSRSASQSNPNFVWKPKSGESVFEKYQIEWSDWNTESNVDLWNNYLVEEAEAPLPPTPPVTMLPGLAPLPPDAAFAEDSEVISEIRVEISLLDLEPAEADVLSRQTGTSLNDLQVEDLSLYPNPSDGRFQLKFDLPGEGLSAVKIFDVSGNEIYAETLSGVDGNYERMIDISDKSDGAYFLQVTRNGQSYTKKLLIN